MVMIFLLIQIVMKKGRYYVVQYGEKYLDQADEGAYKWVFNPTNW